MTVKNPNSVFKFQSNFSCVKDKEDVIRHPLQPPILQTKVRIRCPGKLPINENGFLLINFRYLAFC